MGGGTTGKEERGSCEHEPRFIPGRQIGCPHRTSSPFSFRGGKACGGNVAIKRRKKTGKGGAQRENYIIGPRKRRH